MQQERFALPTLVMCVVICLVAATVGCLLPMAPAAHAEAAAAEPGAPLSNPEGSMLTVPYTMFQLPNGLTVILHEDHSIPRIGVNMWYHVGSGRELPGRTGLAHLFEHLMFEGSAHVPEGAFDNWLEAVGGENNGSTSEDRTNYWEDVPSNALDLALFLESDRMGYLVDTMNPERVDGQRDVVKNEHRQSYENRPYGTAELAIPGALFPAGHPYSWPVIGSMEDLTAASYEDVVSFFRKYYGPGNVVMAIAGDLDPARTRAAVEKWFADVPAGPPAPPVQPPPAVLPAEKRMIFEDQVQLPKLMLYWPSAAAFDPSDASLTVLSEVLGRGKNSRLYRRLVYELQIAQDVTVYHYGQKHAGTFAIEIMARPGRDLDEILRLVDAEIADLKTSGASAREIERSVNGIETRFLDSFERVGGFGGKADGLNYYWFYADDPDYFAEDLARFKALAPSDVQAAAVRWLVPERLVISVVPQGMRELAVAEAREGKQ